MSAYAFVFAPVCVCVCAECEMHHCSTSACVEDRHHHHHLREIRFIDSEKSTMSEGTYPFRRQTKQKQKAEGKCAVGSMVYLSLARLWDTLRCAEAHVLTLQSRST